MWNRLLESLLFAAASPYRPPPGFAEWVLFGLILFILGCCFGSVLTALFCSARLRRLLLSLLLEAVDRPQFPAPREDRLAGYRRQD